MDAQTGMHEFRRDIMPHFAGGNQWQLIAIGAVIAVVIALYASYFQVDLGTALLAHCHATVAMRVGGGPTWHVH